MLSRPVHLVVTCVAGMAGTAGGDATRRSGAARGQGRAGAAPRPGDSAAESHEDVECGEPRAHMEALKKNPLRRKAGPRVSQMSARRGKAEETALWSGLGLIEVNGELGESVME